MSTVLASTSQADGSTTTTSSFPFGAGDIVTATCVNGVGIPTTSGKVQLQLSVDNVNWIAIDSRWFGQEASQAYYQTFRMSDYVGASLFRNADFLSRQASGGLSAWTNFRLYFYNNVGAAITIAASGSTTLARAILPLTATTATTGGAVGAWQPPEGNPVIIERVIIYVITASTGAANVNAGIAANATTSNSGFIAATSVHTSASIIDSNTTAAVAQIMTGSQFLTFTGSASTVGMVANAYIDYIQP